MPIISIPSNLAFDTYAGLVSALNDWLDRDDLSGNAQQMVALAEARMRRELAPLFAETTGTVTAVDGIGALPADCSAVGRVVYCNRTLPQLSVAAAVAIPCGSAPYGYTLEADSLRLWPAGDYTVTLLYRPDLPQLTDAAPTNELLDRHPDLYFYGAMMFAEGFLANDDRAALFKSLFDEALAQTKQFLTRQKFGGPLVPRAAFVP